MRTLLRSFRHSLFSKVVFTAGLVLLLSMAVGAFLVIRYQSDDSMEHVLSSASRLSDTIRLGCRYAMMINAREDIQNIVNDTARQEDIEHIRVLNKRGEIKFSSRTDEIDRTIPLDDEGCVVCHRANPPLVDLDVHDRSRVVELDGHRALAVMTPVYNEPGCSPGPCHFHPEDKQVLGLLDVTFSLESTDRKIEAFSQRSFFLAVTIFALTFLAMYLFLRAFVKQPVTKLMALTRRIAKGQELPRLTVSQDDEVGELAASIDRMGRQIQAKHAELVRQKEEYQNLFELVPCIITVQDRDFRLLSYNQEFADKFAPEPGQHCYEAYKGLSVPCEDCPVARTFADGSSHVSEENGYSRDGSRSHWIVTTSPIRDDSGEIVAAMEMCLDITPRMELAEQLERSEEKYRAIFNTIPNPVFVLDPATLAILDCNEAVQVVYGYPREQTLKLSFADLFLEEDREMYSEKVRAAQVIPQARQRIKDPDALPLYVFIRVSPADYLGREVLLVTTSDITKRLETEQQLIQASKMATLGEMATGVAHELNQPLSVIKTASSFFMNKIRKQEPIREDILRTMAEEINSHVDRASKIINHMREFGRKPEMTLEPVDVNRVLHRAFEIFSQQLKLREIEVDWELDENLPLIQGDSGRLEQVFINLLINARDAIEEKWDKLERVKGAKRIALSTRAERGKVVIEVADTGPGIPKAIAERIFEPFFTTKKVGKGTGLGLSISYGIVKDCGGAIRVAARKGWGAVFVLDFPLPEAAEADPAQPNKARP
ncbi:MAG: ATP-binding protein [Desulfovibrio sp.]